MTKYYWIKERHNPQFKYPYYIGYGNITTKHARAMENPSYGYNTMFRFTSKKEYEAKLRSLKGEGYSVDIR